MIKAFAFDLDGLLIDSEPLWLQANINIFKTYGIQWNKEDQQRTTGISTLECAQYMSFKTGGRIKPEIMHDLLINQILTLYNEGVPVKSGVEKTLNLLKGYPLAIASSSPASVIKKVVEKLNWVSLFSHLISCDCVPRCKPSPDIYEYVCQCFSIKSFELVVFEDSSNGIVSAYKAKAKIIAIPDQEIPPPENIIRMANLVLHSLNDFDIVMIGDL